MLKIWFVLGVFFLVIAFVGIALPLLPTTPLVLLAAGCFAKSSPRTYRWLVESDRFGPVLQQWEERRCVERRVKRLALSMIVLVGGSSVWFFVPPGWVQIAAALLLGVGIWVVVRLTTCDADLDLR